MNRRSVFTLTRLVAASLSVLAALAGCRSNSERYGLHELGVSPQEIREIEPLELKKVEPNEAPPEGNEPPAQLELSLPQCRVLALENNLELKAELISPTIAAAALSAEEAKFEATFFANVNATKLNQPAPTLEGEIAGSQSDAIGGNFGVQVPLRTGGQVTFTAADDWTKTNAVGAKFNPYYSSDLSLSLSQPLLRNAGQWVNTYSIRLAAYNRDISDTRSRLDVIAVLAALDRVYWRLYAARRELEVRQQQYELAQTQLERARRLVEAGQRSQVEIIRAEAGVAQQLEAIITAENNLRDRERELKRVIHKTGLDIQTATILIPTTEPDPVRYVVDRPQLVRTAISSRMELLELQLQLLQDASTIDYSRNQTLPLATVSYTYNIPGVGASQNDALDMLFYADFGNHIGRLQMAIPLGNEAAKSRLRQAIYQRRQRLATRANREDLIRQEVLNAVDQIEANWQRILAARQSSLLNGRLFEAEQRQFEQGLRTSTDVLNAQINFANAQSAEVAALADYQIALVDLAYATGTILGAARVHWEPIVPPTDVE
jgi:outer membrane protein